MLQGLLICPVLDFTFALQNYQNTILFKQIELSRNMMDAVYFSHSITIIILNYQIISKVFYGNY